MHPALQRNMFFVKEHAGVFKAANNYDVLDPETGQIVLLCREDELGFFTNLLRFTDSKQKFFSIGGRFTVLDPQDQPVCTLQGNWTGWDFKFVAGTAVLAQVTKKWAGLGKALP